MEFFIFDDSLSGEGTLFDIVECDSIQSAINHIRYFCDREELEFIESDYRLETLNTLDRNDRDYLTSKGRLSCTGNFAEILNLIESKGHWAHGGKPWDVAVEWRELTSFSVQEIKEWLEAGCFRAEAAFWLDNAGLSPLQCAKSFDGGFTIAYAVSNADLSVAQAQYIVENYDLKPTSVYELIN